MKLSLDLRATLTQTLTPQQIQYLKLLQLPVAQLEQQVLQEIELNPMLEGFSDIEPVTAESPEFQEDSFDYKEKEVFPESYDDYDPVEQPKSMIDDTGDPFEFYKMIWQDDSQYGGKNAAHSDDDDDYEQYQIKDSTTFFEELVQQFRMLPLSNEMLLLGEQIIGSIDDDGYLRRELIDVVEDTNNVIAEANLRAAEMQDDEIDYNGLGDYDNPARMYALSSESKNMLSNVYSSNPDLLSGNESGSDFKIIAKPDIFKKVTIYDAEFVLKQIQSLDPPGIGSRTIQECLIAQCIAIPKPNAAQKLALEILTTAYDPFIKKHYHVIIKQLEVTEDYLREAIEVIRRLNPKPGGGELMAGMQSVIPDFIVERDEETNELLISVNDSRLPALKLSKAYDKLKRDAKYKIFNKDTREWIRNKYEDAKFLIQAIRQRKSTMLKVMTAIAGLQKDFFDYGHPGLKPLIYKDVAESTGLDISTICRIVNGKYVQSEFGTFELKFFFSESLPTDEGEEVSTTVIKQVIKSIIETESKDKPYSDDKIVKELKVKGYNVARRTVAKYREQLRIPVARLRKEL